MRVRCLVTERRFCRRNLFETTLVSHVYEEMYIDELFVRCSNAFSTRGSARTVDASHATEEMAEKIESTHRVRNEKLQKMTTA